MNKVTAADVQAWFGAISFLVAFVIGLRSSWRLRRRYLRAKDQIEPRNRLVLQTIVIASWLITVAAGWIGSLSMLRILTNATFPWTPPITLAIATAIVFIPAMFEWAIARVADIEEADLIQSDKLDRIEAKLDVNSAKADVVSEKANVVSEVLIAQGERGNEMQATGEDTNVKVTVLVEREADAPQPAVPPSNPPVKEEMTQVSNPILGREPTLWLAVIASMLSLIGTFGFRWLDPEQAALVVAAIYAVVGAINAYAVRPISPVAFSYAIGALVALGSAYGLNIPQETVGMLGASVVPILALLSRGQVSPTDSMISRSTTSDEKAVAEPGAEATPSATIDQTPGNRPS